ncbi:MAG: hypothetical protein HC888_01450 [Candidatus Competibacteraceae bacterium]|nr:hypothetical protein [Candidatus Competibacteraceae bacterium]
MQAALLALKAVPGLLGLGGAAGAAGATASGVGALTATLGTVGTIYSTIYGMKQAKVAEQVANENSSRASFAGQVSAQDADIEAAAAIAAEQEARSFSGFSGSSGTFARNDRRSRILARRDAERIRQDADLSSSQFKAQAAEARSERRNIGLKGFFDTIGGFVDMKTSLISDASLVNQRTARNINKIGSTPSTPASFTTPKYKSTPYKPRPHSERF